MIFNRNDVFILNNVINSFPPPVENLRDFVRFLIDAQKTPYEGDGLPIKMAPDRGGDTDAILVAGVGFEPTTFWL